MKEACGVDQLECTGLKAGIEGSTYYMMLPNFFGKNTASHEEEWRFLLVEDEIGDLLI